jgi:nucleoside-diphosphate-sugar epimerase
MRILVAGGSGVIGRNLIPMLVEKGHAVTGTTRSAAKTSLITSLGAKALIVDVFDQMLVRQAVTAARPDVIIHQLTDLPDVADPSKAAEMAEANARLRIDGTRHLMGAAKAVGVKRVIAQSVAWLYAEGPEPHSERDVLNLKATGPLRRSLEGVFALESAVTGTPGVDGIVLRYGPFYGAGTWTTEPNGRGSVHVKAAACAAALAVDRGKPGLYNIAEDDGFLKISKARKELGFDPAMRSIG